MEILLNKLKYRSWHRGTKEADILLGVFFDTNFTKMNKQEFLDYEDFLNIVDDTEIVLIVQGKKKWPKNYPISIVKLFQKHINRANFKQ